jgi:hypothetical protein
MHGRRAYPSLNEERPDRRDCALIPRSRLITHRERTPQRRHAPIAEYALVIHRSARIADGA